MSTTARPITDVDGCVQVRNTLDGIERRAHYMLKDLNGGYGFKLAKVVELQKSIARLAELTGVKN